MNVAFFITTYNTPNLRISLPALNRYIHQNSGKHHFKLLISNDNPDVVVNKNFVASMINFNELRGYKSLNTTKNRGCLGNRLECILHAQEELGAIDYFMFIDDDDVILNPSFDSYLPTINHHAVVTHRLLEVLKLIDSPEVDLNNQYFEYEEWKMGCVGVGYYYPEYLRFIRHLQEFLPTLYRIYGSERVMEPDDVILMNLWRAWLEVTQAAPQGKSIYEFYDNKDDFSYSLTFLEDRKGRYEVEEGLCDLRYGQWDGKTTYASIINPINEAYYKYLDGSFR